MDSFADLPAATAPPDPTPPFSGNSAHPPYPEMIVAAIAALDDKDGSSRQAIAKYIEREYSNLPPTHPNLLTHHLKQMKNQGDLMMIKHSYGLPPPRSVPFQSHPPPPPPPPPPPSVIDNHFTQYSITATDSVTPRRKPGRPPKPRHDFGYQPEPEREPEIQPYQPQFEHQTQTVTNLGQGEVQGNYAEPPIFASIGLADEGITPPAPPPPENAVVSAKRGRGRPPKSASAVSVANDNANASGSLGSGSEGQRKRGRPRLMSISKVNGGVVKRGRPKRIGVPVTVPLSDNVTTPRGRPKRVVSRSQAVSGDDESGSVSRGRGRGRGRPPKNKFRNSFGQQSKVGPGTAVIVTDPHQLVAYQELKLKYEHLQSKAREVVGVVTPYINPDYEAFGALQELEMLVGTGAIVQGDNQQQSYEEVVRL